MRYPTKYPLLFLLLVIFNIVAIPVPLRAQLIVDSFAGRHFEHENALTVSLKSPYAIALDSAGALYIADSGNNCIRKMDSGGMIGTIAGSGPGGFSGDGGPALQATLNTPRGIAVDPSGNIYFSDTFNHRVRKIDHSGKISTVAGKGTFGRSGDGGPATLAELAFPHGLACDQSGNLFIADTDNSLVRKVDPEGVITTVAGDGFSVYFSSGAVKGPEGINATLAHLRRPIGVATDSAGNLYIADTGNQLIEMVDTNGIIHTVAGNGQKLFGEDGTPQRQTGLSNPMGVAISSSGTVVFADTYNQRVRIIEKNRLKTIAGNGFTGLMNAVCPATSARLRSPASVAVDLNGNVYIADTYNNKIKMVDTSGQIHTVAGRSVNTASAGLPSVSFSAPQDAAFDKGNCLLVADREANQVIKICKTNITLVAGNGDPGYSGDSGPALKATLNGPSRLAINLSTGDIYIADSGNHCIRKVDANGMISTTAGTGRPGFSGDGGPASSAALNSPKGLALDRNGNLFIADTFNHRIRKVTKDGIITTVAGSGFPGFSGDGGPAASSLLNAPRAVAIDVFDEIYIADTCNHRIRKVSVTGTISTIAGNGTPGFSGDKGFAVSASLNLPHSLTLIKPGSLYISDTFNHRIRKLTGTLITTITGNGKPDYSGDGGPAISAGIGTPEGIALDAAGSLYFADMDGRCIRRVH